MSGRKAMKLRQQHRRRPGPGNAYQVLEKYLQLGAASRHRRRPGRGREFPSACRPLSIAWSLPCKKASVRGSAGDGVGRPSMFRTAARGCRPVYSGHPQPEIARQAMTARFSGGATAKALARATPANNRPRRQSAGRGQSVPAVRPPSGIELRSRATAVNQVRAIREIHRAGGRGPVRLRNGSCRPRDAGRRPAEL